MKTTESEITMVFDRNGEITPEQKMLVYEEVIGFMESLSEKLKWERKEMIFNHTGVRKI